MSAAISSDVIYVIKSLEQIENTIEKSKDEIFIKYNNKEYLNGNNHLTKEDTQVQPTVEIKNIDNKSYRTLIMIDPDAPSREDPVKGPVLHWLVANFQKADLTDGQTLYLYKGPSPPPGSGPHRYIFFLYQSVDKISEMKFEFEQRLRFHLEKYINENQLSLLNATYFTVDNENF